MGLKRQTSGIGPRQRRKLRKTLTYVECRVCTGVFGLYREHGEYFVRCSVCGALQRQT